MSKDILKTLDISHKIVHNKDRENELNEESRSKKMKNQMQAYLTQFGIQANTDTTLTTGERVLIVAPNRFGPGYIKVVTTSGVWSADLNKAGKLCQPKQQSIK